MRADRTTHADLALTDERARYKILNFGCSKRATQPRLLCPAVEFSSGLEYRVPPRTTFSGLENLVHAPAPNPFIRPGSSLRALSPTTGTTNHFSLKRLVGPCIHYMKEAPSPIRVRYRYARWGQWVPRWGPTPPGP